MEAMVAQVSLSFPSETSGNLNVLVGTGSTSSGGDVVSFVLINCG